MAALAAIPWPDDEAPEALDELARLQAELESLAYAISHDLRASARRVFAYSELLKAPRSCEEGQELMHGLQQASAELSRDMDAVLMYSRLGRVPVVPTEVHLGEVMESIWGQYAPTLTARGVRVRMTGLPVLQTDTGLLRHLMAILADNALKATLGHDQPEIWVQGAHQGSRVRITVRDNGIGFEQAHHAQMFRMFQRVHSVREYPAGSGCGLAFARRICQRLGGSIRAHGTPGQGAHMVVSLPA